VKSLTDDGARAATPSTAAVLSIGTELTRGEITNTNQRWLAAELTALGVEVTYAETVADDPPAIIASLRRLGAAHRLIACTGGLGPTTDDLTSATVAQLLGVPLERDTESLEIIRKRISRAGRELSASNASQADFPRGSEVLPNSVGSAPGFAVDIDHARAFFMPGVPHEMRQMFRRSVRPFAEALRPGTQLAQVRLRGFGLPESQVNDRLQGVEEEHLVSLGYRAHFPEIEVKVLARRATLAEAQRAARGAADAARQRLGDFVYGEGPADLPAVVGELLSQRGLSLVSAESCTGGLVSQLITSIAGSSRYYSAGAVTYTNASKHHLLGVDHHLIEQHGAVSEAVASAMARGALERLGGDVSVALTGIAGPGGGSDEKPVGLVYYAVASRAGALSLSAEPTAASSAALRVEPGSARGQPADVSCAHRVFRGDRDQVRLRAAWEVLNLLRKILLQGQHAAAE